MSAQSISEQIESLSQAQLYQFNQIAESTNSGVVLVLVGESTSTTWGGTVSELVAEVADQSSDTIAEVYAILKGGNRPALPVRKE